MDATIAMDHLIMAATELGLGTCWIAAFDPKAAREVLGLPDDVEPVAFTTLGYPADKAVSKIASHYQNWLGMKTGRVLLRTNQNGEFL